MNYRMEYCEDCGRRFRSTLTAEERRLQTAAGERPFCKECSALIEGLEALKEQLRKEAQVYADLTKSPEIIIKPECTLVDGYEFEPRSLMVEMADGTRVDIVELVSCYQRRSA